MIVDTRPLWQRHLPLDVAPLIPFQVFRPIDRERSAMTKERDVSISIVVKDGEKVKYEHTVHAPSLNAARRQAESIFMRFYEREPDYAEGIA